MDKVYSSAVAFPLLVLPKIKLEVAAFCLYRYYPWLAITYAG